MRRPSAILFGAFLYYQASFMVWVLCGALTLFIARDFGLSMSQKVLLVSVPALGSAALRLVWGYLGDRYGARNVALASMVATLVPLAVGAFAATSYGAILGVAFMLGIAGASFTVALPLAGRAFPAEKQGMVAGIIGAGNSGAIVSTLFAPVLAAHFGWHAVFGLAALPICLALAIFLRCVPADATRVRTKGLRDYVRVLTMADTWRLCFLYSVTFGGFLGLVNYLAIFFNMAYGVDRVRVGEFCATAALAGALCGPIGGYFADKIGGLPMLRIVYVGFALCAIGIASAPTLPLCELFVIVGVGLLGAGNGSVLQIVSHRFSGERGIASGFVGSAGGLGAFYLPNLFGVLRTLTGGFQAGFLVFALIALMAALLITIVRNRWTSTFLARRAPLAATAVPAA